jgi:hypothetical protein
MEQDNKLPQTEEELFSLLDAVAETLCELEDVETIERLGGESEFLDQQRPLVRQIVRRALKKFRERSAQ